MSTKSSRPTTPSLKLSAMAGGGGPSQPGPIGVAMMDPASPPQTPTSVSPLLNHSKPAAAMGQFALYQNFARPSVRQGSNIRPVGTGHQFSYTRGPNVNRFAQLSPQSSSEDEEDEEEGSQSDSESTRSRIPRSLDEDEEEDDEDETPSRIHPRVHRAPAVRSSSEEEDDSDDDEDDDESSDDDEEIQQPPRRVQPAPTVDSVEDAPVANFVLEEMSDYDPMNDNRSDIMRPTGIESPKSQRARSLSHGASSDSDSHSDDNSPPVQAHPVRLAHRPRHSVPHPDDPDLPDLDRGMSALNCTPEAEDDEDEVYDEDAEAVAFAAAQREIRMRKRRSHGSSIGKRTHSERSDSDGEKDWTPLGDDVDVLGGSARRLRRRVGDRRSLLTFQDPPPERIEELEEPDSCAEDGWRNAMGVTRGSGSMFGEGDALRELPYWDLEIMEVDDE